MIKEYIKSLYDLFYPELCVACKKEYIEIEKLFCLDCYTKLPFANQINHQNNEFTAHFTGKIDIEIGISLFHFVKQSAIQKVIKELKYENKPQYGILLGEMLANSTLSKNVFQDIDMIIPIPLHSKKKIKRGYNQSNQIAIGISNILSIPISTNNLIRVKNTLSQTKMNRDQRLQNIEGAFVINDIEKLKDKHILLVDDVLTTGATLIGAGKAILKIENTKISMATIAMGQTI